MSVLSDERALEIAAEVYPDGCEVANNVFVILGAEAVIAYSHAVADAALAADRAARAEAVGWQFFHEGRWVNGMETNNHRANTEAAGIPVRDVFATPPAAPAPEHLPDATKMVVPEDISPANVPMYWRDESSNACAYAAGFNACRRAMLAAAHEAKKNGVVG